MEGRSQSRSMTQSSLFCRAPDRRRLRRRNAASNPPFPEREIVRPGPRRQGFASPLRALDCSGPVLGDSLFMRERGELQRRGSPPGTGRAFQWVRRREKVLQYRFDWR